MQDAWFGELVFVNCWRVIEELGRLRCGLKHDLYSELSAAKSVTAHFLP